MKPICEKTDELVWMQPRAMERMFELQSGEEALGSLRWQSGFGSRADAIVADGHWTFKRTGFFSPQITVRTAQSEANLAVFTPNWKGGGTLVFSSGQCFIWGSIGFWHSQWSFTTARGEHLIDFVPQTSFFKRGAAVKVTPEGSKRAELSLLVLLGWYLMVLRSDDDATAVAAASVC